MQLDFAESIVVEALSYGDLHFTELLEITALPPQELIAMLTKLELFGLVNNLSNNYYGAKTS
jgi:predicted Rossmann fold nucleotide-binding protein DprA/Smf involved in DNA uptake